MKAKGRFISFLLVVDTFFVAYAYGFHSRQVLVVDPKLPPLAVKVEKPAMPASGSGPAKGVVSKEMKSKKVVAPKTLKNTDLKKTPAKSAATASSHAAAAKTNKPLKKTTKAAAKTAD